jgi:hypothetical protein
MSIHAIVILSVIFAMAIPSWAKPIWNIYKTIFSGLFQLAKIVMTNAIELIKKILSLLFKGIDFLINQLFLGVGALLVGLGKLLLEILKGLFELLKAILKFLKEQISNLINR